MCSPLAHFWNEIEHDLVYKPKTGALSTHESESLTILGNLTLSGDMVIKQLFDANERRVKDTQQDEAVFLDEYDFVTRMRDEFPECKEFGRNAGQLSEDIVSLGLDTKTKVCNELLRDDFQRRSKELLGQLQNYVSRQKDDTVQVEPDSSDALLVLLLDARLDEVLNLHSMGRGQGRPPRIASFAKRFKGMREHLQNEN